ncbi:hypothetical protein [Corynebacterium bovis]|uniref:Uncharacterized protein n=1 Tax=Corynebacterium bovis TaxID=36808 RepID=A0A3R8QHY7_9CORY|nr:hypothetical protein [Corynebacterium bovis]RRO92121.1 hypothetical protein CXF40_04715 [Corynebacterium bovis]RRO97674.1 hypothetical protein CXF32_03375 [Corynebacterium bovis]RRO98999.1 hypothetical protein CXF31_03305 [Corynebacterium bovis]RRQ00620.1 hypothetical protein CXF41_06490 [Corynebacterium bovis]RRQ02058.1 hypothetical protein CXF39_06610 [Corynebacterium bovis]
MVTPGPGGAPRDMPRNAARDVPRDLARERSGGDPYRHLVEEYLAGLREITAEFERVCAERADLLRAHGAPDAPPTSASSAAPGVTGKATVPQSCGGGVRLTPADGPVAGPGGGGVVGGTSAGPVGGPGGVAPGLVGGDDRPGPGAVLR